MDDGHYEFKFNGYIQVGDHNRLEVGGYVFAAGYNTSVTGMHHSRISFSDLKVGDFVARNICARILIPDYWLMINLLDKLA